MDSGWLKQWYLGEKLKAKGYQKKVVDNIWRTVVEVSEIGDGYEVDSDEKGVSFVPVWVGEHADGVLFDHAERVIVMSGTIPDLPHLEKQIGLTRKRVLTKRLPYSFPLENRPIYIDGVADLTRMNRSANIGMAVSVLDEWIDRYPDKKGLVHAGTYQNMKDVLSLSRHNDRFIYHSNASERAETLSDFKDADDPLVLISPSMTQAVDLPGDECEFIIVLKLPYAYLGTKVMRRRAKDWSYYSGMTLLMLRQMIGRGTRKETDRCDIVILDAGTPLFMKRLRSRLPKDVKEATEIIDR